MGRCQFSYKVFGEILNKFKSSIRRNKYIESLPPHRGRVQVFRREFHTHIHLDQIKIEILSCIKKKKNIYIYIYREREREREREKFSILWCNTLWGPFYVIGLSSFCQAKTYSNVGQKVGSDSLFQQDLAKGPVFAQTQHPKNKDNNY